MSNQTICTGAGQLAQLHLEDEITKRRRCLECGVSVEVLPRKPRKGERLSAGFVSVAILPPHRAHT